MGYWWGIALSFTIFIPAILGLFKFRKVDAIGKLIIVLIWAGALCEGLSLLVAWLRGNNLIVVNIYSLVNAEINIVFFYLIRAISRSLFVTLSLALISFWIADFCIWHPGDMLSLSYFNIVGNMMMALICIAGINHLLSERTPKLHCNAFFIVSLVLLLEACFFIISDVMLEFGTIHSIALEEQISRVYQFVNVIMNFLLAYAVLCMPPKKKYSMEF